MTREEMLQGAMSKPLDDKTGTATDQDKKLAETLQFMALKLQQLGCQDVVMFASGPEGNKCLQVALSRESFMMNTILDTFESLSFTGKMLVSLKLMMAMKQEGGRE